MGPKGRCKRVEAFFPILVLLVVAIVVSIGIFIITNVLGPRNPSAVKLSVYECGVKPEGKRAYALQKPLLSDRRPVSPFRRRSGVFPALGAGVSKLIAQRGRAPLGDDRVPFLSGPGTCLYFPQERFGAGLNVRNYASHRIGQGSGLFRPHPAGGPHHDLGGAQRSRAHSGSAGTEPRGTVWFVSTRGRRREVSVEGRSGPLTCEPDIVQYRSFPDPSAR